jgi:rod shape-determining protein MreC
MFKRPYYIAVVLVTLLILLVLNLPGSTSARLKHAIGSLFVPLFGITGSAQEITQRAGNTLLPKSELIAANEALLRQNQELRLQILQADAIVRENDRLRQMLNWQKQTRWTVRAARVIYRDPANWWRTVQINLGSRNGVSNNLPVLSSEGYLVGRISAVSLTQSQVVLIGDANCKVPALVQNDARDTGVITPGGPLDGSFVKLTHLAHTATLQPGQKVVTSGFSAIYRKDIPIGQVVDSWWAESGLQPEARVKLSANLSSLEEVWVLFP